MSKPTIKQTYTGNTSYNFATKNNPRKREYLEQGIMSIALAKTIAQPKEPTLFDNVETDTKLAQMQAIDNKHLINRAGEPTYLTQKQHKIVYALALFLSHNRDDEEFRDYVNTINQRKATRRPYSFPISITELTKLVSTEGKAKAQQKEQVLADLRLLSEIKQVQTFEVPDKQGGMVRLTAPLIILKEQMEDLSPDKALNADFVVVEFGSVFFSDIYNCFAVIKPQLFDIWGKTGSGTTTELFSVLLSDLLAKYRQYWVKAQKASKSIKRSQYKTETEYNEAKEKVQTSALTYPQLATTIRSRVTRDYESTRKQRNDFKKDLQGAIQALITIGLITSATFVTTPNGERIDFVFNIDYDKSNTEDSITIAQRELEALPE
jgi:hypothetical protein